jgi:DNA topoisomerase-1
MAKNLVIVESPAKAKTINKYLGRDFQVEASYGHIRDLPEKGKNAVDVAHDFAMTYEVPDKKKAQVSKLRKLAREAEIVWLATDLDREGEAIAWHLMDELRLPPEKVRRVVFNQITKKAIQDAFAHPGRVDMDKVSAQEARRALDRLVGYEVSPLLIKKIPGARSAGRVQTVAVRLIVEREREVRAFSAQDYWRVGAVLSRQEIAAAAKAAYDGFMATHRAQAAELAGDAGAEADDKSEAKSDGEAEPTVSGAARKELDALLSKHKSFRAELFQYAGDRLAISADAVKEKRGTILDAARARTIVEDLRTKPFAVTSVEKKERQDRPRPPFTTATLQQAASSQLRFPAAKTMSLAQKLYEGVDVAGEGQVALITYMRTDSTYLSDQAIQDGRAFIGGRFGPDAVPDKPNHYSPKAGAQGAHEAIRPTEPQRAPDSLSGQINDVNAGDLLRLYRLIWTRFIACQMKPAVWNVTEVQIAAGAGLFRATGRELKSPGYTALTGVIDDETQMLPPLAEKDPLSLLDLAETRHATQPPPRFTEAGLVKELERQGIGRPSTYANIIQTIQDRNYVRLDDRKFFPTFLGEVVVDRLVSHIPGTFEVKFTSEMENSLDDVEAGRRGRADVLRDFWGPFSSAVDKAEADMPPFMGQPSPYLCEKCGAAMEYRLSRKSATREPFLGCTRYPECDNRVSVDAMGKPKDKGKETETACEKCGRPMVLRSTQRGKYTSHFLGCSGYGAKENPCENTKPCDENGVPLQVFTPEKLRELDIKCVECGREMALKQGRFGPFLGCTGNPECKAIQKLPPGYYIPKPPPQLTEITCDKCGKPLAVRAFGGRKFLGCTGFPKCRNAKPYELFESGYKGVAPKSPPKAGETAEEEAADSADETITKKPAAKKSAKKSTKKAPSRKTADDDALDVAAGRKPTKKKTAKQAVGEQDSGDDDGMEDGVDENAAFDLEGKDLTPKGRKAATAARAADHDDAPFDADGAEAPSEMPKTLKGKAAKKATAPTPEIAMNPDAGDWGKCPDCGKPLAVKPGKWGPFLGCTGFPKCKRIVSLKGEAKKKAAEVAGERPRKDPPKPTDVQCPDCGSPMVERSGRGGKFLGCTGYPKCRKTMQAPKDLEPAGAEG